MVESYISNPPIVSRGAVNSDIGHLEDASGLAGIIKTIMVLGAVVIPPNANPKKRKEKKLTNSSIDAESLKIMVRRVLFDRIICG